MANKNKLKDLLEDANDFYKKGNNKESLEKYEEILAIDKDNLEAIFRISVLKAYNSTYEEFNIEQVINTLLKIADDLEDDIRKKYISEAFITVSDLKDFAISVYLDNPFNNSDVDDLYFKIERCILAYKMLFNIADPKAKNEISKMIIITYDFLINKKYCYSGYGNNLVKVRYHNNKINSYKKERRESLNLLKENSISDYNDLLMYYAIIIRNKSKIINFIFLGIALILMIFSIMFCKNQLALVFLVLFYIIGIPYISVNIFREKVKLELITKCIIFILGVISIFMFINPIFTFNKTYNEVGSNNKLFLRITEAEYKNHLYDLDVKIKDDYYEFKLDNNTFRYRYKNNVYYLCLVKDNKCNKYFYDKKSKDKFISSNIDFLKYFK